MSADAAPKSVGRSRAAAALVAAWLAACVAGVLVLIRYDATPGATTSSTPAAWPAGSRWSRPAGRAVLVAFLHPYCPCSRATLGELDKILSRHGASVDARVVLVRPRGAPAAWSDAPLRASASAIRGVSVEEDVDGVEAARFGAETSGAVVLYDGAGRLLFHGGITISRGHAGGNPGEDAVVSLLTDGRAERDVAPVFGCPLVDGAAAACPAPAAAEGDPR